MSNLAVAILLPLALSACRSTVTRANFSACEGCALILAASVLPLRGSTLFLDGFIERIGKGLSNVVSNAPMRFGGIPRRQTLP